ncbi:MAG: hypothetical protein ACI9N1_001081 [Flavobacteriales bacterium]|jgi:hypothetical protein
MIILYTICLVLSLLINLFGLSLFIGSPGLQYIISPIITGVSVFLIIISMLFTKRSRFHLKISIILSIVSILTIIPSTYSNGIEIKSAGLFYFGLTLIVEVIMLFLAYKNKHLFE